MTSSSRDRITVDLHGMGVALAALARERRLHVSHIVREAVARVLDLSGTRVEPAVAEGPSTIEGRRLSIRLTPVQVTRLDEAARAANLSRSAMVSGLVDGIAVFQSGGRREHLQALIRSSAELSTLSRNIRHLASLLRDSEFSAAREYRAMLDSLAADIAKHLVQSGRVLGSLTPSREQAVRQIRPGLRDEEVA